MVDETELAPSLRSKLWRGVNIALAVGTVITVDVGVLGGFGTSMLTSTYGATGATVLFAVAAIASYRFWRSEPSAVIAAVWCTAAAVILGGFSTRAMLDGGDYRAHNCWEVSPDSMVGVLGDTFFECAPGSEPRQWSGEESSRVCDHVDTVDYDVMDTRETTLWAC